MSRVRKDGRMVHKTIKKVAQEMAGSYYEHAASHKKHGDEFYKAFPSQKAFMKSEWRKFVQTAKECMTQMLANPLTPEAYKQDIYHALLLDATLPYSQQETQIVNIPH